MMEQLRFLGNLQGSQDLRALQGRRGLSRLPMTALPVAQEKKAPETPRLVWPDFYFPFHKTEILAGKQGVYLCSGL
jgi:hypothetical protein